MGPFPLFVVLLLLPVSGENTSFAFHGFRGGDLRLDGAANVTDTGLLRLTNATKMMKAYAFYPSLIRFRSSPSSAVRSFSTTFAFGIRYSVISGHGIVLVISRSTDFSSGIGSQFFGLFNASSNMNGGNHVLGVELDTIQNPELKDIDNNHVGVDVDSLISVESKPAGYFTPAGKFLNLSLSSGDPMQVWVDYAGGTTLFEVRLAPLGKPKPRTPLISKVLNISAVFDETMHVGFSASTGPSQTSHYILGWSFNISGEAKLDAAALPSLPRKEKRRSTVAIWLPITVVVLATAAGGSVCLYVLHRVRFSDEVEDWEKQYGPHRFPYKTLFDATKGFAASELLGSGGFGSVYRGRLQGSGTNVAVKRVAHDSRQGLREFVAEIASLGRVRHRNLVQLLGYCRRRRELMLVYEYIPNGSLDKRLFAGSGGEPALSWEQRLRVIRGVARGLLYLHEEWEQVVIHRDVKASNVLLDGKMNGKLGDFGLARLYDHGGEARTTHVVGTIGYLAPELARTARATRETDVFAFGAFVLEVVTGRRPVEVAEADAVVLAEWVLEAWRRGAVAEVVDERMGGGWEEAEVERVVRLGLVCSHPVPSARPPAREVVRVLEGKAELPGVAAQLMDVAAFERLQAEAFGCMPEPVGVSYAATFATGSLVSDRLRQRALTSA